MPIRIGTVALIATALGLSAPASAQQPTPVERDDAEIATPSRKHGATSARIVTLAYARPRPGAERRGHRLRTQTTWSGQQHVAGMHPG